MNKECHVYTTPQSGSIGLHCRGSAFVFHCDSISSYVLLGLDGTKPLTRFLLSCVSWLTHRLWGESMGSRLKKKKKTCFRENTFWDFSLNFTQTRCLCFLEMIFWGRQEIYCRVCGHFCFCHPVMTRRLSVSDRLSVRLKSCVSCTDLQTKQRAIE